MSEWTKHTCRNTKDCPDIPLASLVEMFTGMPYTTMQDGSCQTGYKFGCYEGQCGLAEVHPGYACVTEHQFRAAYGDIEQYGDCRDTTAEYVYEDYEDYYQSINDHKTSSCNQNLCPKNSSCSHCQFCLPQRHLGTDVAGGRLVMDLSGRRGVIKCKMLLFHQVDFT